MLKYTRAVLWKLLADFKSAAHVISIIFYSVSAIYPIYSIIANNGYLWANIVLAVLAASYLVFYLITYNENSKSEKERKKTARAVYKWCKRGISLFTLGITVYSVYFTAQSVEFYSLLLTAFMVVMWVVDLLLALLTIFLEKRIELLSTAFAMDGEGFKKLGNAFKVILGDEIPEDDIPPKMREAITAIAEEHSVVKTEKKAAKREDKKERRRRRLDVWRRRLHLGKKSDQKQEETIDS